MFRSFEHRGLAGGVFLGQLLEEVGLPGSEIPGDDHLHLHQKVALTAPLGVGNPFPSQADYFPGLGAGRRRS